MHVKLIDATIFQLTGFLKYTIQLPGDLIHANNRLLS